MAHIIFKKCLFYVYECFVCAYTCTPHAAGTLGHQKVVSNSLGLELWMVVNHHVGVGN